MVKARVASSSAEYESVEARHLVVVLPVIEAEAKRDAPAGRGLAVDGAAWPTPGLANSSLVAT